MIDRAFIAYLAARVCISLAMLSVTIGWHLYQHSGNPFDLALVGLMQILPMLSLFILTGWVIDHFSRKTILVVCAILDAVVFTGLALNMMQGDPRRFFHRRYRLSCPILSAGSYCPGPSLLPRPPGRLRRRPVRLLPA